MCMSTVYEYRDGKDNLVCDYVREAKVDGDVVRLIDVTGNQFTVTGAIRNIDLVKNTITIDGK